MSWFMNPFLKQIDFNWLLGDRHHIPKFVIPPNCGRGDEIVTVWERAPYDLSGTDTDGNDTDTLSIVFAINNFQNWAQLDFDITTDAASTSAVGPVEIMTSLNSDDAFNDRFTAEVDAWADVRFEVSSPIGRQRLRIRQKNDKLKLHFYIKNGGAEEVLRFNAKAGIAEAPTYFERHQLNIDTTDRFDFDDGINSAMLLDPAASGGSSVVDNGVINNAWDCKGRSLGFDASVTQEDWELLEGKSGIFLFTNVVSGTETIIYHAGAKSGDLARKIITDSGNTFEIPHTLEPGDLITPP